MSLLLHTIESFPRGRTTEELMVLLDVDFESSKRLAICSELSELSIEGLIKKNSDGRWQKLKLSDQSENTSSNLSIDSQPENILYAIHAEFKQTLANIESDEEEPETVEIDHKALLRYWRSTLRSDPRGAIVQNEDLHGVSWVLVSGSGPVVPDENNKLEIAINLDSLPPDFRQALVKREANEQTLAFGWPIFVSKKLGVPGIWPVGLLSAEWERSETKLHLTIEADDLLVNPEWIDGMARETSWTRTGLQEQFKSVDGIGFQANEFLLRFREIASGLIQGKINGNNLKYEINTRVKGIYDTCALFLPTDTSFTAGAVRDLDRIANWEVETLSKTALAPLLGLESNSENSNASTLNIGPLNSEQISAVTNACEQPLTVVTGPPGTGKSQAIVSAVASILATGGNVLVASKNHKALDAVEDRLKAIAPDIPILVRTLNPDNETDVSLQNVLEDLIKNPYFKQTNVDEVLRSKLHTIAKTRIESLNLIQERAFLNCQIAELIERIELRKRHTDEKPKIIESPIEQAKSKVGFIGRILNQLKLLFVAKSVATESVSLAEKVKTEEVSLSDLNAYLEELRTKVSNLKQPHDPVDLTSQIADLVKNLLPGILANITSLSEDSRQELARVKDDLEFANGKGSLDENITRQVLKFRPVWLASVLGTPRRIPLTEGLFDLVIFDEASQCDIASSIPLLARAKRAVIVGDSKQLSFIPQLGRIQDRNLMKTQGLPVKEMSRYAQSLRSLYEFAEQIPNVPIILLRNQYRSTHEIVNYISNNFYGGKLRIAYEPKQIKSFGKLKPGVTWTDVPARTSIRGGNINQAEAEAIIKHLTEITEQSGFEGTIGIISPFRHQVALLWEGIRDQISNDIIEKVNLLVATVDSFQGMERDLILFSPVLSESSTQSALTFVQKDWRRLNVAISRARVIANVFGDLNFARSNKVRALAGLASFATEPRTRKEEGVFDSDWERRVYYALKERKLDPIPQYEIAGRRLDFALFGLNDVKLDVEVDGRQWHLDTDGNRKLDDIWRDHQLKSMGWRVRRFWVDELAKNMEACLDRIEQDLSA